MVVDQSNIVRQFKKKRIFEINYDVKMPKFEFFARNTFSYRHIINSAPSDFLLPDILLKPHLMTYFCGHENAANRRMHCVPYTFLILLYRA